MSNYALGGYSGKAASSDDGLFPRTRIMKARRYSADASRASFNERRQIEVTAG
jgi:hypothetical protein